MRVHTMRRATSALSLVSVALLAAAAVGSAQTAPRPRKMPGTVMVAPSSVQNAKDLGKKAHTNLMYINSAAYNPLEAPPYGPGYYYETPSSLGCIYHLVSTLSAGCNPYNTTAVISGGGQSIAIVDAFDDPEAAADLAYFSDQFGIPFSIPKFQVIYADGYQPDIDYSGGWEVEESLDIEYAHAMAPNAMLYLVEAASNSFSDLFTATTVATNLVQCGKNSMTPGACLTTNGGPGITGKGEVSMSWGGGEFTDDGYGNSETTYDSTFSKTNVVFFASSGDSPGTIYPAASPNVVSVGGTSISRNLNTGNFVSEIAWSDAGSGPSSIEPVPAYQSSHAAVSAVVGKWRGTPDVSAVANPYTGVWVYDTMPANFSFSESGWWIVGGTSVASPVWAGIVNKASAAGSSFAANSTAELTKMYNNLGTTNYTDITSGYCYFYMGYHAAAGYDLCTGIGSPLGLAGK